MLTTPALNEYVMLEVLAACRTSARQLSAAGLCLWASVPGATFSADNHADAHIRFNVAFSQQPRLADYLRERLESLEWVRAALERVVGAGEVVAAWAGWQSRERLEAVT